MHNHTWLWLVWALVMSRVSDEIRRDTRILLEVKMTNVVVHWNKPRHVLESNSMSLTWTVSLDNVWDTKSEIYFRPCSVCRCFDPGGQHQRVILCACSLFRMVMQEEHRRFILIRAKKALHTAGWERLYYLAPKRLYRENTSSWERGYEEKG